MELSQVKGANRFFAGFLIKRGFSNYLPRMRKTKTGYRCMQFEMNIEESVIIEKNKYKKSYGGNYYENMTDVITHRVIIEVEQDGKEKAKTQVVSQDTYPYWF